ncbi:MAG TPA: hypothetical protein VM537_35675 [Anaerolineae bacterium]|nr:hypothetical protein [Anaerolineae bacterium]
MPRSKRDGREGNVSNFSLAGALRQENGSVSPSIPPGNVRICNHSPVILGNLQQDSFLDIYYHHPYVRDFHDTWPTECVDCDPELRELCGGGCKAAAEQCYGTLQRVDPFVTLCREASCLASGS